MSLNCTDKIIESLDTLRPLVDAYSTYSNSKSIESTNDNSQYFEFINYVNRHACNKKIIDEKFCVDNSLNIYALQCAIDDKNTRDNLINHIKSIMYCPRLKENIIIFNGIVAMLNVNVYSDSNIVPIEIPYETKCKPCAPVKSGGKSRKHKKNHKSTRRRKHNTRRRRHTKK